MPGNLARPAVTLHDPDHMSANLAAFSPDSLAVRLLGTVHPSRVRRHRLARGAHAFRQGDPAAAVFLVETGRVRLSRSLEDGSSLSLYVAEAGDSFAEASLSAAHYHCDAIAETDAVVLAVPKADLLAALAADPAECLALALALASQVRDLRARLELRNIRSASMRVLTWLRLHASGNPPMVHRTSPAGAGEVETRSGEGEGDRVGTVYLLRCGPITLTLGAAHHRPLPLPRERSCAITA